MHPSLANLIGRSDLASVVPDRYSGTTGGLQSTATITGGASHVTAGINGRLTAGVALVALVLVVGFYIWTRDVQA